MRLLAVETSSQACSVALSIDGVISEKHEILGNKHSQYLLEFIDELIEQSAMTKSDLNAIAVGIGPGSFTGLRLGLGVAQGLGYGLGIPLIPVSSLMAIAAVCHRDYLLVAVDARMSQVYWQCFHRVGEWQLEPVTTARLDQPRQVHAPDSSARWFGAGSGWDQYFGDLQANLTNQDDWLKNIDPSAGAILRLAEKKLEKEAPDSTGQVLPDYIRNKVTG